MTCVRLLGASWGLVGTAAFSRKRFGGACEITSPVLPVVSFF